MSDMNMYNILGQFNGLVPKNKPIETTEVVYEDVDPRGDIMSAVKTLEERYAGFNEAKVKRKEPEAVTPTSDLTRSADPDVAKIATKAKFIKPELNDFEAIVSYTNKLENELEKEKQADLVDREKIEQNQKMLAKTQANQDALRNVITATDQRFRALNDKVATGQITAQDQQAAIAAQQIEKDHDVAVAAIPQQADQTARAVKAPTTLAEPPATTEPTQQAQASNVAQFPDKTATNKKGLKVADPTYNPNITQTPTGVIHKNPAAKQWGKISAANDDEEFDQYGTYGESIEMNKKMLKEEYQEGDPMLGVTNYGLIGQAFKNAQDQVILSFGGNNLPLTAPQVYGLVTYLDGIDPTSKEMFVKKNLSFYTSTMKLVNSAEVITAQKGFPEHQASDSAWKRKRALAAQKNNPKQLDLYGTPTMENINNIAESLMEKYMGWKKTVAAIKKGGSAEDPEAVAAAIGRKKYGKAKFQKAAAQGKKLGEESKPDFLDLDKDGDTNEPMKSAAKSAKEHEPAAVDKSAVEKRKRLQALKDKQEDERRERGEDDHKSSTRFVKGRAYGGSAQKDAEEKDELEEKAVSKAQQKFMGMVYATKKGEKAPSPAVAKVAKGMTTKAAKDYAQTKHKGLPQHVEESDKEVFKSTYKKFNDKVKTQKEKSKVTESRNHESSEYTYETVGRILSEEQPHLDCNSEAFVKAVYDELIEMKMTPKAARWLCHYDEDFLSDTASAYSHFCDSKDKEMAECGAPMNAFVSEEPVVDAQQELDEIARLAGLPVKDEGLEPMAPADSASPLTHTCEQCGMEESKCGCTHEDVIVDESAINEAATRKDFRMVADLLKAIPDMAKRTELALHHADVFKEQNPRFKKEMFLAAAGVDTTPIKDESVETEGNAFTGKLAATPKGGEFKLGDKTFKDTSDLEEEIETEGNEFSGALAKAKAAGEKEFEVDGKKYTVKEDININVSANGEEDVVNLIRKLSGMPVVAIQAQPAVAEEVVVEEGPKERDVEYTNTPREVVAGTDAAIPAGADLNRAKKQYKKEYPGDNPMAVKEEALWKAYESMINDVKA